jgi:hypothetical protein
VDRYFSLTLARVCQRRKNIDSLGNLQFANDGYSAVLTEIKDNGQLTQQGSVWANAFCFNGGGCINSVPGSGGITGTGTDNYLPKFATGGTTLTNSIISDDGTGTATVSGNLNANSLLQLTNGGAGLYAAADSSGYINSVKANDYCVGGSCGRVPVARNVSCPPGKYVTGFDASGGLICKQGSPYPYYYSNGCAGNGYAVDTFLYPGPSNGTVFVTVCKPVDGYMPF